jgi:NH3-dependent NAD+ synthetase
MVCGISGGVDSAVTSTCALKQERLCVEMPIHQHESHVVDGTYKAVEK